jgi:hypothetical protein
MNTSKRKKRTYKKITAETVAKHKAAELLAGNGTAAVEIIEPDSGSPKDRAYRIARKSENMPSSQYMNDSLEQIAAEAIQELGELIHSNDEAIRTRNVHYAIDQTRGKAVTKSISLVGKTNIQSVLD